MTTRVISIITVTIIILPTRWSSSPLWDEGYLSIRIMVALLIWVVEGQLSRYIASTLEVARHPTEEGMHHKPQRTHEPREPDPGFGQYFPNRACLRPPAA